MKKMNPLPILPSPVNLSEPPHPALAPYIRQYEFHEHYWTGNTAFENNSEGSERNLCFMPETSIDFVIGDPFKKSKPNARKLVLKTRAILRTPSACKNCMPQFSGHFIIFNIKFHPTGMHRLFGFTMNSLGNNSIALEDTSLFPVEEIVERMMYATHISTCIQIIEQYLLPLAMNSPQETEHTALAAQKVIQAKGQVTIQELASTNCLSVSQLEKNFNKKIGVSPKTYASMHRLFGLLRDKTENREDKWSELAYKHNYYDPLHFTREFNKYLNLNPS